MNDVDVIFGNGDSAYYLILIADFLGICHCLWHKKNPRRQQHIVIFIQILNKSENEIH